MGSGLVICGVPYFYECGAIVVCFNGLLLVLSLVYKLRGVKAMNHPLEHVPDGDD